MSCAIMCGTCTKGACPESILIPVIHALHLHILCESACMWVGLPHLSLSLHKYHYQSVWIDHKTCEWMHGHWSEWCVAVSSQYEWSGRGSTCIVLCTPPCTCQLHTGIYILWLAAHNLNFLGLIDTAQVYTISTYCVTGYFTDIFSWPNSA